LRRRPGDVTGPDARCLGERTRRDVAGAVQGEDCTGLAAAYPAGSNGVRPLTESVGDCYGNAMCEGSFETLESELLVTTP